MNISVRLSLLTAMTTVVIAGCQSGATPNLTFNTDEQAPTQPTTISEPTSTAGKEQQATPPAPDPVLGDTLIRPLDGKEIVYVPGGDFVMGSDEQDVDLALQQCLAYGTNCARGYFSGEMPLHSVILDSFWIDKIEVTSRQYLKCEQDGVCEPVKCEIEGDHYPVVCVTWSQAAVYCQWAGVRLPTEAEWEYSARGPERNAYPWGDEFEGTLLNYCDSNCTLNKRDEQFDDGYAGSAPVGSYPLGASWVGALDMAGNVWEMVADWNGAYSEQDQLNPSGPQTGSRRVARGGSWHASPDHVRSALRTHMGPNDTVDHAGFRCAQSPQQD